MIRVLTFDKTNAPATEYPGYYGGPMLRKVLDTKSPLELILWGFGLLLMFIALLAFAAGAAFVLRSELAEGRIVAYQVSAKAKRAGEEESAARAPVIEFMASDGKLTRIVGAFYERDPSFALDQIVPIRYRSGAPEAGVIDVFTEKWAFPFAIGATGIFFVLIAGLFRRKAS